MKQLIILFYLFSVLFLHGQTGTIDGRIVSKSNNGIPNIQVSIKENTSYRTYTNVDGAFSLVVPSNQLLTLIFQGVGFQDSIKVEVDENEILKLNKIKLDYQSFEEVQIKGKERDLTIEQLPMVETHYLPGVNSGIEQYLIYTTPARSNNELTSNYNVRGGSYDENLIYVNGFEIYRPFLTRSGQQEGMSFINPNLVEDISFSAGGFASKYGDRLSSVLDITYRNPTEFKGSFDLSLLGAGLHLEDKLSPRFSYTIAGRYRDQSYVLNALPVKGSYRPRFYDFQLISNFALTENLNWSLLGHFSSNDFRFAPESQDTRFGTINQALSFKVYFEGEELTKFQTITGATTLNWNPNRRIKLDWYLSAFNTDERETFDILGQYFINEVETDPSKEEFGDSIGTLGVGSFLNHARNQLKATLLNVRHTGKYNFLKVSEDGFDYINNGSLSWGIKGQYDLFDDVMSEWKLIDSAGYSIPQEPANEIELFETIKAQNNFTAIRSSGFFQFEKSIFKEIYNLPIELKKITIDSATNKKNKELIKDTITRTKKRFYYHAGIRFGYTTFNNELYFTPRAGFSYFPSKFYLNSANKIKKRSMRIHAAAGLYYQPPIFRELRNFNGEINFNVQSQKSFHLISGIDYTFELWGRKTPFKMTGELFYKYLWDVNPYQIDNVRTRYYAINNAIGHAYGLDWQLNGEFIPGMLSFFKIGLLRTVEDLLDDDYYVFYNSDGEQIIPGYTFNNIPVDSSLMSPGFIPKPTDQWVNIATFFQDQMPGFEQFTVQLGLNYGSRLPYGPPDQFRHRDTLRQKPYFRVDIGFGYDLLHKKIKTNEQSKLAKAFSDARISFEIFNLLGINNVLSQQWIQDTEGRYYAIPNYLTQRRFNLKLTLRW